MSDEDEKDGVSSSRELFGGRLPMDAFDGGVEFALEVERQREFDPELAFVPPTDLGNAERFVKRWEGRLLYCPALGWLWWDGRRWATEAASQKVKLAEHYIAREIQKEAIWLRDSGKDYVVEVRYPGTSSEKKILLSDRLADWGRKSEDHRRLSAMSQRAMASLLVRPDELDADPMKINVGNGTLRVHRKLGGGSWIQFYAHSPGDRITKLIPIYYDPSAGCPTYDAFLTHVQPREDVRRLLHQWFGLSLTGDMSEQRVVFFWGKGRNGKSTLVEIVAHLTGDYGCSVPVETFLNDGKSRGAGQASPDLAMLKGVRFAHTNEPEKNAKLSEGLIKAVTGGDTIRVRELNKGFFSMLPMFKLTISGNYRPRIDGGDTSHGIWRRMILIPWGVTIDAAKVDKQLPQKLKEEAGGILNRLLKGLVDWADNGLVIPEEVKDATEDYRDDSDALGRFLGDCTVTADGKQINATELHDLFRAWATAHGETPWGIKGHKNAMIERGFRQSRKNRRNWQNIKAIKSVADFGSRVGKAEGPTPTPHGDDTSRRGLNDDEDDIPL